MSKKARKKIIKKLVEKHRESFEAASEIYSKKFGKAPEPLPEEIEEFAAILAMMSSIVKAENAREVYAEIMAATTMLLVENPDGFLAHLENGEA